MAKLRTLGRLLDDEAGIAAVEFSLLTLPLFLLIFGIIDFGLGIWTYNNLSEAANQGAREAIVRGSGSSLGTPDLSGNSGAFPCSTAPSGSLAAQVCTFAVPLNPDKLSVNIAWSCPTCGVSSRVTVAAEYVFEPILSQLFPMTMNLKSEATMRVACCKQP